MSQRSSGSQQKPVTEDEQLLRPPPPVPAKEGRAAFTRSDPWRVRRIMGEFVEGFDTLSDVRNAVSFFGSARTQPGEPMFERTVETARLLYRLAPGSLR